MPDKWYERAIRRNVVDMHIPDWNEEFMSRMDPVRYADLLAESKVQSTVLYAHSHAGTCFYPTRVGHMHAGLQGRDLFGELVGLLHERGIYVQAYHSLIYDTWAYSTHPDFRMVLASGRGASEESRYGTCCPNSPYCDHVVAQIEEICAYEFEGIRFDMTFWPEVCYCHHCRERFAREVGGEMPETIDWLDPTWVALQRRREAWLTEFAAAATSTVKPRRPVATVEHQISTLPMGWKRGVTMDLVDQCDLLQGDFYGGKLQGSYVKKLLYNAAVNRPYGFETAANVDLGDHTTLKPREQLRAKAFSAIANSGAFIFIDGIDPVGTLNPRAYQHMGEVFEEIIPYEKYFGGELCQDVAVYLSTESKFDFGDSGKHVHADGPDFTESGPHQDAGLGAAQALLYDHIPFGVITRKNLAELSDFQVVILPNVLMMSETEAEAFRTYVRNGGGLYASHLTSLTRTDGVRPGDFLLADVFGASHQGQTEEDYTFIAPTDLGRDLLDGFTEKYPMSNSDVQMVIGAHDAAEVLGTTVLPYTARSDWQRFASIHSDPPGINTGAPAMVRNRCGRGQCIYVTGDFERQKRHGATFARMIRSLLTRPLAFESDAPRAVEITALHQPDKKRFIVNALNFQEELPNIPVEGFTIRLHLGGRQLRRVLHLPAETDLPHTRDGEWVVLTAPRIETLGMFSVEYE